jgi:hypothetical protein
VSAESGVRGIEQEVMGVQSRHAHIFRWRPFVVDAVEEGAGLFGGGTGGGSRVCAIQLRRRVDDANTWKVLHAIANPEAMLTARTQTMEPVRIQRRGANVTLLERPKGVLIARALRSGVECGSDPSYVFRHRGLHAVARVGTLGVRAIMVNDTPTCVQAAHIESSVALWSRKVAPFLIR